MAGEAVGIEGHAEERDLRQEWRTPPDLFGLLNDEFQFEVDAAATKQNVLCPVWYGPGSPHLEDALSGDWGWWESCFCNPGFSNFPPWVEACIRNARNQKCTIALVGLVSPSTEWWRRAERYAQEIRLCSPRPQFLPPITPPGVPPVPKSSNPREIAVFVFSPLSVEHPRFIPRVGQWRWREDLAQRERLAREREELG